MGTWSRFLSLIGARSITSQSQPVLPQLPSRQPQNYGSFGAMSGGSKWHNGLSSSGAQTSIDSYTTLQNVRAAYHESPQLRILVNRPRDLTVDTGLKLEPTPAWEQLGVTNTDFKEKWTEDHEQRFDIYMQSKQCHRSGTMTGYQLQRLYSLFDGRDNDQFVRFFYNRNQSLMSPVQLEFIDPSQIRGSSITRSSGFQDYTDGIKRDIHGREISYLVTVKRKVKGVWKWENIEIPARGAKSGRVFMLHGFEPEYAGQGRGYSKLHFALQDFENIVDYVAAQTKKAINQGDMIGFVKPSDSSPASNPWEGMQGSPSGPITDPVISANDDTGEFEAIARAEYTNRIPGSDFIANLQAGEEIKFLSDTAPGPQFDAFITSIFKHTSAATGYPFEVMLMAFNSNYSASRAALLEAFRTGRIRQADIKADLIDIWWEMWMSEEIAAGRSQLLGWSDSRLKPAWLKYRLQGPPLPSIDPGKDRAALEKDLKYSLTTQEAAARSINGSSAKANMIKNKKAFAETPTVPWEDEPLTATESDNEGE